MADLPKRGFDIFSYDDSVKVSRMGTSVKVIGREGQNVDSNSVEANLLFEILKALRAKK